LNSADCRALNLDIELRDNRPRCPPCYVTKGLASLYLAKQKAAREQLSPRHHWSDRLDVFEVGLKFYSTRPESRDLPECGIGVGLESIRKVAVRKSAWEGEIGKEKCRPVEASSEMRNVEEHSRTRASTKRADQHNPNVGLRVWRRARATRAKDALLDCSFDDLIGGKQSKTPQGPIAPRAGRLESINELERISVRKPIE
jgi:hypothetical protein